MFVLHRAGQWFAGLLQAFDDALVALDDDIDVPAWAAESKSLSLPRQ